MLISVGHVRDESIRNLCERYSSRIPHYMPFEPVILPDIASAKNSSPEIRKSKEGEAILSKTMSGDYVVLLDERGKRLTSRDFSRFIEQKAVSLSRNLIFVIGGPYGFSKEVYHRADMQLSLSDMTFPHEVARFMIIEQIYRALTILRGEPYHHD